jgi:hypothetical protein
VAGEALDATAPEFPTRRARVSAAGGEVLPRLVGRLQCWPPSCRTSASDRLAWIGQAFGAIERAGRAIRARVLQASWRRARRV